MDLYPKCPAHKATPGQKCHDHDNRKSSLRPTPNAELHERWRGPPGLQRLLMSVGMDRFEVALPEDKGNYSKDANNQKRNYVCRTAIS